MSSIPESVEMSRVIQALHRLHNNISVSNIFEEQMKAVNHLLRNDYTGFIGTTLDFMVHASTVSMKIETKNDTLDKNLELWQETILNKDINMDIPRGLRELSCEYFRERWKSSFIALKIQWKEYDFGGADNKWIVPVRMYLIDGSTIIADKDAPLNKRKYYLDKDKTKELINTKDETVIIRKPFNSWYDSCPTPYLVKRGVLFNALLKQAIISKQADIIQQIIPYLLLLKAGNEKLMEAGLGANEEDLKKFKQSLVDAIKEHDYSGELGKLIAAINGDVKLEHFIPDLTKIFDEKILKSVDKNILAGLGMIELQGFSQNRQEAILNPKVLVEEVKDAVNDWASILKEITYQMVEKNKEAHRNLVANKISIVPGTIKAFLTENMKRLLMNLHDRGVIDSESFLDDVADKDLMTVLERRDKEAKMDIEDRLYPRIVTNQEQYAKISNIAPTKETKMSPDQKEKSGKKPGTPEAKNYKNAEDEAFLTENYIRIRHQDPDNFQKDSFKTLLLSEGLGIKVLIGKLENDNQLIIQSYLFDKDKWTESKAKKWVKINASDEPILVEKEIITAPYTTIDELPSSVKNSLPLGAQVVFMKVVNESLKDGDSEETAFKKAWGAVKKSWEKDSDGTWKKRK